MKKLFLLVLTACLLASCSNEDDTVNLQISSTSIVLNSETTFADIKVLKGAGEYIAVSSDDWVAMVKVKDNTIRIFGAMIGKSTIKVSDKNNNTAFIDVEVSEPISRPEIESGVIHIKKGEERLFNFKSFDKNYITNIKDENLASVVIVDNKFLVTGKEIGETEITVEQQDMYPIGHFRVNVVEQYDLDVTRHFETTIRPGRYEGIRIYRGSGDYSIESTDEASATAIITPYEGPILNNMNNPAIIWFNPIKEGIVPFMLKDNETGEVVRIVLIIKNTTE